MQKHPELVIFGNHLRELRIRQGFTQESFAHTAGIHPRYYSAVERGERNVSTRNLIKIAHTLKIEIGDLFPPIKKLIKAANL